MVCSSSLMLTLLSTVELVFICCIASWTCVVVSAVVLVCSLCVFLSMCLFVSCA